MRCSGDLTMAQRLRTYAAMTVPGKCVTMRLTPGEARQVADRLDAGDGVIAARDTLIEAARVAIRERHAAQMARIAAEAELRRATVPVARFFQVAP